MRTRTHALASMLHEMDERQVRDYAATLPPVRGAMRSRDVHFVGDDLVLKLAPDPTLIEQPCYCFEGECLCFLRDLSPQYGAGQNEAEALLWRQLVGWQRRYFAEVYASSGDGLWLIQERVSACMDFENVPLDLEMVARSVGIGDLKSENCGWRGEQPVILDYGISRTWEEITGKRHISLVAESEWRTVYLPDA